MPRRHPSRPPFELLGAMDVFVRKLIETANDPAVPIADRVGVGRLATQWCAVRFGNKIEADDNGALIDDLRGDLVETKSARNQRDRINRAIERATATDDLESFRRKFIPSGDARHTTGGVDAAFDEVDPDVGSDRRLRAGVPHDDAG